MTAWTDDELARIGQADELRITSRRPDGTLRPSVTIWVVRDGSDLYVRSAFGSDNPWFRRAKAAGAGHIRAGGLDRDVTFAEADPDVHERLDAQYRTKYRRWAPSVIDHMVGPQAVPVTIRLLHRAPQTQP